jgi:hypothetical protein
MFASKSLVHQTKTPFRNLIMLFFTIVFGFGSVMVMADLNIQTSISNARQTIMRITITSDGTDSGTPLIDFNSGGKIFISTSILDPQVSFSGNILWLDANGKMIYVPVNGLIVSWTSNGNGNGDSYWTGNATDIWNSNVGNVGIGTAIMSGKLHITNSGGAELVLEETNPINAANIHFINPTRTRTIGSDSAPDLFYIGIPWTSFISIISWGNVGIWTNNPKAPLQVVGNLIVGEEWNNVIWEDSTVLGWKGNTISGDYNIIWWGDANHIVSSQYGTIVWWRNNTIQAGSRAATIIGGHYNMISWSQYSVVWGIRSYTFHDNSFVRNSQDVPFGTTKPQTFLINAIHGVWIRTNDPQWDLDIAGSGVVVLEPQTINPQWTAATCTTKGSIIFNETSDKLCYCDWAKRMFVDGAGYCAF